MSGDGPQLPADAVVNGDGSVTLPLIYPVQYSIGDAVHDVSQVTIRRKKMADNLAIKSLTTAVEVAAVLIERLTGIPAVAVQKLDDVDSARIGDVIEGFSMPGRATGSNAPV